MLGKKVIMLLAVLAVLIFSSLSLQNYYNQIDKYQWREVMEYIEESAYSGDYVVVYPEFEIQSAIYYQNRGDIHIYPLQGEFLLQTDIGYKDLWFVLADHARSNKEGLEKTLGDKYELVDEKRYKSLNLYQYKEKNC